MPLKVLWFNSEKTIRIPFSFLNFAGTQHKKKQQKRRWKHQCRDQVAENGRSNNVELKITWHAQPAQATNTWNKAEKTETNLHKLQIVLEIFYFLLNLILFSWKYSNWRRSTRIYRWRWRTKGTTLVSRVLSLLNSLKFFFEKPFSTLLGVPPTWK